MRILIIHPEPQYYAGAEKVLIYYLQGAIEAGWQMAVAAVPGTKFFNDLPESVEKIELFDDRKFSIPNLLRQLRTLSAAHRSKPFDRVHGWAARDWELTAAAGFRLRIPAFGTLHDHPAARFFSKSRRFLMKSAFRWRLCGVACVSEAVRQACVSHGYASNKLAVVHNGLPPAVPRLRTPPTPGSVARFGFLGAFSERKGLSGLFEILRELAALQKDKGVPVPEWELHIAGDAQDDEGRALLARIRADYSPFEWWRRIRWLGWMNDTTAFLSNLDLLVFPSNEFDPLPTVLLEAGKCAVPVLAARVGGVEEIVQNGKTGWLFEAGQWRSAALGLAGLLAERDKLRVAGAAAATWVDREFSLAKMVAQYQEFYSTLSSYG